LPQDRRAARRRDPRPQPARRGSPLHRRLAGNASRSDSSVRRK
jgi:hypothetical protein